MGKQNGSQEAQAWKSKEWRLCMELQSPSQGKLYLERAGVPSVILTECLSQNHGDEGTVNKKEMCPAFMAPGGRGMINK